jgi:hypothetical protein
MTASSAPTPAASRSGWVTFAGVMFLIAGAFNLLDGIVALVNDDYFVADELLFGDLSAWGVWWLVVGTALALVGIGILMRMTLSVIFGIGLAAINAVTQLMWLGVYPAWAIAAIVVDGLIIWALTTHMEDFG